MTVDVLAPVAQEHLERQSTRGWLLPYLLQLDVADVSIADLSKKERKERNIQETCPTHFIGPRRWDYWGQIIEENALPAAPIPYLHFTSKPQPQDARAVQDWLQPAVRSYVAWYDEAWLWLVKWLLWGFGYAGMGIENDLAHIPDELKVQWYRQVNLANLLNSPCDWSAFVLQGGLQDDRADKSRWAKSTGFYSTPMDICHLMTELTICAYDSNGKDKRLLSVHDPCCGTGSMLLLASNYSLRLYGQDIVADLCLCSILNGYLWMPWLVTMPTATRTMLDAAYQAAFGEPGARAFGVQVGNSLQTLALAEQRRESAEAYWKQGRLFE